MALRRFGWGVGAAVCLLAGAVLAASAGASGGTAAAAGVVGTEAEHTLGDLAFLAGRWQSRDEDGSFAEEHWSAAEGTSIMGMFRWVKPDGSPVMFEILTITAEAEGIILRLRHFSPVLAAKEEKDKPMALKLTKLEGSRAVFSAHKDAGGLAEIVYHCPSPDALAITVAFEGGTRPPLEFALAREAAKK